MYLLRLHNCSPNSISSRISWMRAHAYMYVELFRTRILLFDLHGIQCFHKSVSECVTHGTNVFVHACTFDKWLHWNKIDDIMSRVYCLALPQVSCTHKIKSEPQKWLMHGVCVCTCACAFKFIHKFMLIKVSCIISCCGFALYFNPKFNVCARVCMPVCVCASVFSHYIRILLPLNSMANTVRWKLAKVKSHNCTQSIT